ncbi:MAG: K(+)-transporting ATPase subunit C [Acidobacteriota bacterium]|nr:K(+)-transporting ATPase subunit C [Acidobacteriota bacterium]
MLQQLVPALRMTILLTVLTGLIYPGIVTGVCQVLFHDQAHGSLIEKNGQIVGSALIGQNFARQDYFHPRPSAAGNDGYDPTASGGSNLGPTSQKLYDRVKASVDQFRKENPEFTGTVPADAVTASASGLDPDISLANALAQAARVAEARSIDQTDVGKLIASSASTRGLGLLGESRVNVLKLNLLLDESFAKH